MSASFSYSTAAPMPTTNMPDDLELARERISPELALVDPELRRRALAELPAPNTAERGRADALAAHRSARLAAAAVASRDAGAVRPPPRRRRRRVLAFVLLTPVGLAVAGAGVVSGVVASRPSTSAGGGLLESPAAGMHAPPAAGMHAPSTSPTAARTSSHARLPATPARARPAPAPQTARPRAESTARRTTWTFVWPPSPNADSYDVKFSRGGTTVFEARPLRPRLVVPASGVARGRRFRFSAGRYRWVVRPVFGVGEGRRRYGRPIVVSTWTVPRAGRR